LKAQKKEAGLVYCLPGEESLGGKEGRERRKCHGSGGGGVGEGGKKVETNVLSVRRSYIFKKGQVLKLGLHLTVEDVPTYFFGKKGYFAKQDLHSCKCTVRKEKQPVQGNRRDPFNQKKKTLPREGPQKRDLQTGGSVRVLGEPGRVSLQKGS